MLPTVAQPLPTSRDGALPLEQGFELPEWTPAPPAPVAPDVASHRYLVLGDAASVPALTSRLRELGADVVAVGSGTTFTAGVALDPDSPADHRRLLAWLDEQDRWPDRIIVAWSRPGATPADTLSPLLALGRALALARRRGPLAITVLTAGAHDVDGTETVDPAATAALGPLRVLPLELPHVAAGQVDLGAHGPLDAAAADRILAETEDPVSTPLVALRGPVRWLPTLRPVTLTTGDGAGAWRAEGVYVITGGLGSLGLALAEHLAAGARAHVALVGRTALAQRATWGELDPGSPAGRAAAAIVRIESHGGTVTTHAADVTDAAALRGLRDELLARHGRVDGVIHAAGVAGGGLIEAIEPEDAAPVLAPKVQGTLALADVFADAGLDVFVLCSSLASFVGGVGQVAYCAANAYLDAFPGTGHPLAERTLTVNWGGLLDSGMWVPRDGDVGMPMADAAEALRRAVGARPGPRVIIAPVRVGDARPWLPDTAGTPDAADGVPLEPRLCDVWAEVLGIDEVSPEADFFALGGTSLLAVELLWRLADETGVRLPMQLLTDAPTPAAAAHAIEARRTGAGAA